MAEITRYVQLPTTSDIVATTDKFPKGDDGVFYRGTGIRNKAKILIAENPSDGSVVLSIIRQRRNPGVTTETKTRVPLGSSTIVQVHDLGHYSRFKIDNF